MGGIEVRKSIALTVTVGIALLKVIGELQWKNCVSHVPQHLAGKDKCVDNFCKQRAECLCGSFIIVHIEHGQWQASSVWEKSACLTEVVKWSRFYRNFQIPRNRMGTEHAQTVCGPGSFFLCPCTRAWERGYYIVC